MKLKNKRWEIRKENEKCTCYVNDYTLLTHRLTFPMQLVALYDELQRIKVWLAAPHKPSGQY